MKKPNEKRISVQEKRIAQIIEWSKANILVILFNLPSFSQSIKAALNFKHYITLDELSQLYCSMTEEMRFELRPTLKQIAENFDGWLALFKANQFNRKIKPLALGELFVSAETFGHRQILVGLDIEKDQKLKLIEIMRGEAKSFAEIIIVLRHEFDSRLYKSALHLGDSQEKLFVLNGLDISNHRRAYLYKKILGENVSTDKLIMMYKKIGSKSKMRKTILDIIGSRLEPFTFWLRIYQQERHYSQLKHASWSQLERADISPENLVNTCNNYRDKRFEMMAAKKLENISMDHQSWEKIYGSTTTCAPLIRKVIINKQRLAIKTDDTYQDSQKFIYLRAAHIKAGYNYPALADQILSDMIDLIPQKREIPYGSYVSGNDQERSSRLNSINALLEKSKTLRSFTKLFKILAPKISDHEEWIDLSIKFKNQPKKQKRIIEEYKKFFLQDFYSHTHKSPSGKDFRNREIQKRWEHQLPKLGLKIAA